jgi:hypothetical protein
MKNMILLFLLFIFSSQLYSQETDSIEVFLIDNFVTPEKPHTFVVSFFTSVPARSKIIIDRRDEFIVSEEYIENHKLELNLENIQFRNDTVPFIISVIDSAGNSSISEKFELELPYDPEVEGGSGFLMLCIFAGAIFGLPSPALVVTENDKYFSLTKEIPLVSLRGSFYYPQGYFALEYSHIFNAPRRNFIRVGYKHIIEIPGIEYISPGFNLFTDFKGFNGISPEISVGLIRVFNAFTIYSRYRYNVKPGETGSQFQEFSLGLYSGFFSFYF